MVQKVLIFVGFVALYYVFGHAGLKLATINHYASPIWPASGIAIGGTLLFGYWLAPAFLIASFVLNYPAAQNFIIPFCIGIGACLQAISGRYILRRFLLRNTFKDYSEVFSVVMAAVIGSSISALLASLILLYYNIITTSGFIYSWYTWWSGDAIGILMLMPLVLEIRKKNYSSLVPQKVVETSIAGIIMLVVLYFTFTRDLNQAFLWLAAPAFIVIGVRNGRINASITLFIVSCFVTILTVLGYGPFQYGNTNRNLIYIQTLITGFSLSVLFIKQMKLGSSHRHNFFLGLLAATGILFSLTYFTTFYEKKNTLDDFHRVIESALGSIDKTADQYELVLNGTSGAFSMSENVTKDEWKAYVDAIHPTSYFDSVNGLGFVERVKKTEEQKFLKRFNQPIKEIDPEFAAQYDDRFVITYVEPLIGNQEAVGLDLGSEPRRRQAAEQSRRLHRTLSSEPITLVQDKYQRKGFLIFHPTYNKKHEFIGWTYAPVISQNFFGKTLNGYADSLRMRLRVKDEEIYNSDNSFAPFRQDSFYFRKKLNIFGIPHNMEFYPTDLFFRRHSDYSVALPLILNLLVLILAALSIEQLTFGLRAEALVAERTKELDASKMQLVESSKMASLGEMASGMAHEINNPLTIIQGKLQVIHLILNDLSIKDKNLFEELGKIKTTTDRIEKIVKGLRNFSRAANQDPFELTSLKPIVQETLDLCAEKIRAEGINLIIGNIPQVSIRCRPAQISQVLINLMNNSRDAIHESSTKWIELAFKVDQNKVQIIVTDSGPGIPATVAERMMEPFFTTKDVGKGTGLGLSISKGIIAAHGGKLWLDTTSINTRFIIEFRHYS